MPGVPPGAGRASPTPTASDATRWWPGAGRLHRGPGQRGAAARAGRAADRGRCWRTRERRLRAGLRHAVRRLRRARRSSRRRCALEFLLRATRRTGDADALAMVDGHARRDGRGRHVRPARRRLRALLAWTASGWCRTSRRCSTTTPCWLPRYLHAHLVTGDDSYRGVVEQTLDFMLRELLLDEGLFASSLDADTDGVEGATYVWTRRSCATRSGDSGALVAAAYYGVGEQGNFEGASILRPQGDPPAAIEDIRGPSAGSARPAASAGPRRQGNRRLERPGAGSARRGRRAVRTG